MLEEGKLRKIDTGGKAEVYVIDNFLSESECDYLIKKIEEVKQKSTVVAEGESGTGYHEGRTSSSAFLRTDDPLIEVIDKKMKNNLPEWVSHNGESPQGQMYEPGQFFNDHYDWFDNTPSGKRHMKDSGQRNWTFMINLNTVDEGGETDFIKLGLKFKPERGRAVIWKNIHSNGAGNEYTMHAGRAPISGNKYIITKWFRVGNNVENPKPLGGRRNFATKEDLPHFHPLGYELRDLPEDVWGYVKDIYELLKDKEDVEPGMKGFVESNESEVASTYFNMDRIPTLKDKLHKMLLPYHKAWIENKYELEQATCYGIRSYHRGATLKDHYDRVSELHVSGIICVDEKSDEPWPLNIVDHNGNEQEIIMKPGQILLYESATCMHGRRTPFKGDYYRNFYIHYKLRDWEYVG